MVRNLISFAAVIVLITACGGGDGEAPAGSTAGPDDSTQSVEGVTDTEIVLGSHNDLSGPVALLGIASINGARMRFDEVNEAGGIHGRKIRFIVEDSGYQVPRAIQAVNKLVNRDRIFAMMLGMGTPMNNAVMATLFDKGIPNLFAISGARSMTEPLKPLQYIGRGRYYDETRAAARYFLEERGATTPCVVYQDTDFGQETLEGAEDQVAEMGLELAAISAHKPTDSEFTASILRLRNAGCDLVLMGTVNRDTILVLETARKLGWDNIAWVGGNASFSNALAELPSGAAEGYHAFNHMSSLYPEDDNSPEAAAWLERYIERFGGAPEYSALEGYRSADVVVKAMEMAGRDLTREKLIKAMDSMHDYEDIFGYRLSFTPEDHSGVFESTLSVVRDGRWHKLAESITY
jgi:branched-chain amino acid transport system substrate-binding protein